MKRKILRKVFGFLSCSTAVFIFEACYGIPRDYTLIPISGKVLDKNTHLPVEGIGVVNHSLGTLDTTDVNGKFTTHVETYRKSEKILPPPHLNFMDIDTTQHGYYQSLDTTFTSLNTDQELIIYLEQKKQ